MAHSVWVYRLSAEVMVMSAKSNVWIEMAHMWVRLSK